MLTVSQNSCFVSPPDIPPMAYPGKFLFFHSRQACLLNSMFIPPCTMPYKFCSSFLLCAFIQRSIHLKDLSQASYTAPPFEKGDITSSSAIIISLPKSF